MTTGIITQARINSTRLPNKIMLEAGGKSFLSYHIERLQEAGPAVFLATTNDGSEDPIVDFCKRSGLECFRGSENDVLERYYQCAVKYKLDTIIRVTSDCPLIDGNIIAEGLEAFKKEPGRVYLSNALQRTYPRGMDFEIFSFELLQEAFEKATDPMDREHVTPYIWKNRPGSVIIKHLLNKEDQSGYRITLDTEEDKLLITKLIEEYGAAQLDCNAIVGILKNNPSLTDINRHIEQKKV
jgi:spore coat polysaccharide biosynthesis protein SpsF